MKGWGPRRIFKAGETSNVSSDNLPRPFSWSASDTAEKTIEGWFILNTPCISVLCI